MERRRDAACAGGGPGMTTTPPPANQLTEQRPGIGVLVSGRGSNLQAILRAIERGELTARVALVISSRRDAPALEIAAAHGIATCAIIPKAYPSRAEAGA